MSGTRAWGTIDMSALETDAFISGILKRTGAISTDFCGTSESPRSVGGPIHGCHQHVPSRTAVSLFQAPYPDPDSQAPPRYGVQEEGEAYHLTRQLPFHEGSLSGPA
ncbi:similar to An11g04610 [Aspergillus luchuensis]|uniref:Similar to An11g04610 n=1 Tax=Aspergillus kawachii TaxID=1069201 RepID=A0A146EY39_ASPKA|nr:similar to An11g04610 [Aspergillus luchuensis]